MATQYFVSRGEAQHGPFSTADLKTLAKRGKLRPTDLVWSEGSEVRVEAGRLKSLFPKTPGIPDDAPTEHATEDDEPQAPGAEQSPSAAEEAPPAPEERPPVPQHIEHPRRVVSIKGGVLCGQDGTHVRFRKKCEKCGNEEQGKATTVIRPGTMRIPWFCRRCRKGRTVEMVGVN
jgi:hypothetical protein